jgi:hypothetical protein
MEIMTLSNHIDILSTRPNYENIDGRFICPSCSLFMLKIPMLKLTNIDSNDVHLTVWGLGTITGATGNVFPFWMRLTQSKSDGYGPVSDWFPTSRMFVHLVIQTTSDHFKPFQSTSSQFELVQATSPIQATATDILEQNNLPWVFA